METFIFKNDGKEGYVTNFYIPVQSTKIANKQNQIKYKKCKEIIKHQAKKYAL